MSSASPWSPSFPPPPAPASSFDDPPELLSAKQRLREAIRTNILFKRELRKYRRRLLTIFQDKYFLCERLLAKKEAPRKGRPRGTR